MAEKAKISLKDLTITELVQYEIATRTLCAKYENSVKNYDGSILNDTSEYKQFQRFNNARMEILDEMEKRIGELTK